MPCDLVGQEGFDEMLRNSLAGGEPDPLLLASANLDKLRYFGLASPHAGFFSRSPHAERWVVVLDGAPLAAQARRLTGVKWPKLSGSDQLPRVLDAARDTGARVGFLGGQATTHERLRIEILRRWPGLPLSGTWAPTAEELRRGSATLARQICDARTDCLIVALTPRSEQWLDDWSVVSGIRVGAAFGAAIDFLVGSRRRAPRVFQRLGLEWAWRLAHEPRRLARRYLIEGPRSYWLLRRHSSPDDV
jgi:exopolysaccharide biosynthesis WecB/TagA/CpsF family protein